MTIYLIWLSEHSDKWDMQYINGFSHFSFCYAYIRLTVWYWKFEFPFKIELIVGNPPWVFNTLVLVPWANSLIFSRSREYSVILSDAFSSSFYFLNTEPKIVNEYVQWEGSRYSQLAMGSIAVCSKLKFENLKKKGGGAHGVSGLKCVQTHVMYMSKLKRFSKYGLVKRPLPHLSYIFLLL